MKFLRKGKIFKVEGNHPWMMSHSACPVPYLLNSDVIRIYFGTRDSQNHPSVGYIEVEAKDPSKILKISDRPVLINGRPGMFDDNGVYPGCVFVHEDKLTMLYMGRCNRTPPLYDMSIGMALSDDGGLTFERLYQGPVLTRSIHDPWMVSTPYAHKHNDKYRLFYLSGSGWSDDLSKSFYDLKQTEASDFKSWSTPSPVIPIKGQESNIASPYYFKDQNGEYLFFCVVPGEGSYQLEYAKKSASGWLRQGKVFSQDFDSDWDNKCQAYPQGIICGQKHYLFYSGNDLGKEGIGYIELQ